MPANTPPPPPPAPAAAPRACWLDWVRFLAALLVCVVHTRNVVWMDWASIEPASRHLFSLALIGVGRLGHEAVMVFFALSGFFVGGACLRSIRERSFDGRHYAIDRFSRIYPPYLAAILLSLAVALIPRIPTPDPSPGSVIGHLFFLQGPFCPVLPGNVPLWSLAYEACFYVMAGVIAHLWTQRGRGGWTPLALTLLVLSILWLRHAVWLYAACWAFGALAFHLQDRLRGPRILVGGLVLAALGTLLHQTGMSTHGSLPTSIPPRLGQDTGTALLAAGVSLTLPWLANASPRTRGARRLGELGAPLAAFSYSLYLIHLPVLELAAPLVPRRSTIFGADSLLRFSALIALCLLSAWVFALLFERPAPLIRRHLLRLLGSPRPPFSCAAS